MTITKLRLRPHVGDVQSKSNLWNWMLVRMSVSKTFALNSLLQIREHRLDIDKVNLSSDKNQTNFSICRVSLFHLAAIRSLNGTEIKKKGFFYFILFHLVMKQMMFFWLKPWSSAALINIYLSNNKIVLFLFSLNHIYVKILFMEGNCLQSSDIKD